MERGSDLEYARAYPRAGTGASFSAAFNILECLGIFQHLSISSMIQNLRVSPEQIRVGCSTWGRIDENFINLKTNESESGIYSCFVR